MGKKRNRNKAPKQATAAKHNEDRTIRLRLKQELVRVDRNNNPITTSERKLLTKAMIDAGHLQAPELYYQPEPDVPKNVVSILNKKAPPPDTIPEASPKRSEYAAAVRERVNYERVLYSEWHRTNDKRYVPKSEAEAWEFRFESEMYESGKHRKEKDDEKLRQDIDASAADKPVLSLVHNNGLAHKPVTTGSKTPSGLPIGDFLSDKWKDAGKNQTAVVYTTATTASNDDNKHEVSDNDWSAEYMLKEMVMATESKLWPAQIMRFLYHSDGVWQVHNGKVRQAIADGEDRIIYKCIVRVMTAAKQDDYTYSNLKADNSRLRKRFVEAQRRIVPMRQEIQQLEYAYSQVSGDIQSSEEIRKEIKHDWTPQGARQSVREMEKNNYGTAYAKPPEDADEALSRFKLFKNLLHSNGELDVFCRYYYGDSTVARTLQEHADMLCAWREQEHHDRVQMQNLQRLFNQIPTMLKIESDRALGKRRKATMGGELQALKDFRRRAAKRNHVSRIYYSDLSICICPVSEQATVAMSNAGIKPSVTFNGRVVGASCSFRFTQRKPYKATVRPEINASVINKALNVQHWRNSNPNLIKEVSWWLLKYEPTEPTLLLDYLPCKGTLPTYDNNMGECRVRQSDIARWDKNADMLEANYLASTVTGKIVKGTAKAARSLWGILNTNVDPWSRKKDRDAETNKLQRKTYREQARAEDKAKHKQAEQQRDEQAKIKAVARAAFRTAH